MKSQNGRNKGFSYYLLFLLDDGKVRISSSNKRLRIREAKKHTDPTDPGPENWYFLKILIYHIVE